ncbi:MAG: hypothetical protein GXZ01_05420 [Clostridiaceae bacterium]|nr:hypothetical protein [Clostridiaceae bacterium]
MAIRPIDLQVMIPKVADVSRIQANEQQQSLAALQSKAQSVEKASEESMRQVNSQKELQKTAIRDNHERKGRESKEKGKKNRPEGKNAQKHQDVYSRKTTGSTIDIRL